MSQSPATVIYIIHHDPERADQLARQLRSCAQVPVRPAVLQLAAGDYADVAAYFETGAVIIAQDLDPHGALDYTGLDVAEHLRRVRPGLPLYLLAAPEQDLAGSEALVEQVIAEDAGRVGRAALQELILGDDLLDKCFSACQILPRRSQQVEGQAWPHPA